MIGVKHECVKWNPFPVSQSSSLDEKYFGMEIRCSIKKTQRGTPHAKYDKP